MKQFRFNTYTILTDNEIDLRINKTLEPSIANSWLPSYEFDIFLHNSEERLGGICIRIGTNDFVEKYEGNIGFGIEEKWRGNKYAAKTCKLIKLVAKDHKMNILWITCDPSNQASRRTCEIIGAQFIQIIDLPVKCADYKEGYRKKCRYKWTLTNIENI